ncbi:MAG: hypothetical protein NT120_05315 [Candidatus Aenigmarchaeota archaeon]|nr:hypothetical protein [Candidatus Aenigmarchaeota archaeon]
MEKCDQCGKEFETAEALQYHRTAKHLVQKSGMKINKKYVFSAIILIVVAAAGYYFYTLPVLPGATDDFAKCITEKGAIFYGTFWCHNCKDQKNMFGSSLKYVNYIECSTPDGQSQTEECRAANIQEYPTWVFADGSRKTGTVLLSKLASITNCTV